MKVRPCAIIIRNRQLLTMRYVYGNKEVFALPGGNPDPGEALTEVLERELFEEMGIRTQTGDLAFCGEVLWTEHQRDTLHMAYWSEIVAGEPELNRNETTALEIVWLPLESLSSQLLYPNIGTHISAMATGNTRQAIPWQDRSTLSETLITTFPLCHCVRRMLNHGIFAIILP